MDLNKNYPLDLDSFTYPSKYLKNNLRGGADKDKDVPNGGFPPIYICDTKKKEEDSEDLEDKQKREYKTHKTAVSIKSILEKRRDVTPFIKQ